MWGINVLTRLEGKQDWDWVLGPAFSSMLCFVICEANNVLRHST